MKKPILVATTLASVVVAQSSSIIDVFFPGASTVQFIGSIMTSDTSQTTIAIACQTGSSNLDCGFSDPITVTVGPSTFHAEESFQDITAILQCSLEASVSALCAETYIGPAYLVSVDSDQLTGSDTSTNTAIITTSASTSLSGTAIVFIPVTLVNNLEGPAETGAGVTTSTASQTSTANTGTVARTTTTSGPGIAASPTGSANSAGASPEHNSISTSSSRPTSSSPSSSGSGSGLSGGAIGGIVAGAAVGLLLVLGALWYLSRRRRATKTHSTANETSNSTAASKPYEKHELPGTTLYEQPTRDFSNQPQHQPFPRAEMDAITTDPTYPGLEGRPELPGHDHGHSEAGGSNRLHQ